MLKNLVAWLQVDEDGNVVEDEEAPKMPAPPRYDGLTFEAEPCDPQAAHNLAYPPPDVIVPAPVVVQSFSMGRVVKA